MMSEPVPGEAMQALLWHFDFSFILIEVSFVSRMFVSHLCMSLWIPICNSSFYWRGVVCVLLVRYWLLYWGFSSQFAMSSVVVVFGKCNRWLLVHQWFLRFCCQYLLLWWRKTPLHQLAKTSSKRYLCHIHQSWKDKNVCENKYRGFTTIWKQLVSLKGEQNIDSSATSSCKQMRQRYTCTRIS